MVHNGFGGMAQWLSMINTYWQVRSFDTSQHAATHIIQDLWKGNCDNSDNSYISLRPFLLISTLNL